MLHNLSMSTGFSFNSNLLTGHEHVVNSYIDAYMYIRSPVYTPAFVMPLLETVTSSEKRKSEVSSSYCVTIHRKKPSHSRAKRKSLIIIRIEEALWRGSLVVHFGDHLRYCTVLWLFSTAGRFFCLYLVELRSFRLRSVRLRLESIRLCLICQFAYVLKHVLPQFIHLLYVRSRSDPSQSIQFLERDS